MPLFLRSLVFIVYPVLYWGFGWLNFVQVGKVILIGLPALLSIAAWTAFRRTETAAGRWLNLAVVLPFLAIMVFQAFLRDLFGVEHDDVLVIEALFNTNGGEAYEFFLQNMRAIGKHLLLMLCLTLSYWKVLIWSNRAQFTPHPSEEATAPRWRVFFANRTRLTAIFAGLFLLLHFNPTMRKEDPLLYFPLRYAKWQRQLADMRMVQNRIAAANAVDPVLSSLRCDITDPRTVVLVLGESTTRLNWSLYGYPRKTNPQLESLGSALLRFSDVVTTSGSTILDIQKILTPATADEPSLFMVKPDILTMARRAGYKTFWITNHGTDMTGMLAVFANHADVVVNTNRGGSRGEGSHDEVVFPPFEQALDDPAPRKFILLHLLGAHPAFYFRYPDTFSRFNNVEDVVTRELRDKGRSYWSIKMRNYYDNAMLYADHVLKSTIDLCAAREGQPTSWIFIPDHGEDVAHYSDFVGHNTRVDAMFEIPMLYWRSSDFPSPSTATEVLTSRPYQTDMMDHTLLGLMGIDVGYYDPRRDLLSPEFEAWQRRTVDRLYPADKKLTSDRMKNGGGKR